MEQNKLFIDINNVMEFPPLGQQSNPASYSDPSKNVSPTTKKNLVESMESLEVKETRKIASASKNIEMEIDVEKGPPAALHQDHLLQHESEINKKMVAFLVCQIEEYSVVRAHLRVKTNQNWPHFLTIKNDLVDEYSDFKRKLQLGDLVYVTKYDYRCL